MLVLTCASACAALMSDLGPTLHTMQCMLLQVLVLVLVRCKCCASASASESTAEVLVLVLVANNY